MSTTFNGVTIPFAQSDVGGSPRRNKVIEYPGADGADRLDMGIGTRSITVEGVSDGTPSKSTLEGFRDGDTHTLSIEGDSYTAECVNVVLGKKINTSGGYRRYFRLEFVEWEPE